MTEIKVKCSVCGRFTKISGTEQNRAYERGREDERPRAFAAGFAGGYEQGRKDVIDELMQLIADSDKRTFLWCEVLRMAEGLKEEN